MEIFGIGPFELALIALIGFIVLGPERIPGVMRQLGRAIRQMRRMTQDLTREYGGELNEITGAVGEVQKEIRGVQRELNQATRSLFTAADLKAENKIALQPSTPAAPAPADPPPADPPPAEPQDAASDIIDYRSGV